MSRGGDQPTAGDLQETIRRLKASGELLRERSAAEIAESLGRVGERIEAPGPVQDRLVAEVVDETGFSEPQSVRIVRGMARDWTRARLGVLLRSEFSEPSVLDRFIEMPLPDGSLPARRLRALGDPLALHVGAGSVPGVSATSMIRSLLVKTPVLVKPGRGDRALTLGFHSVLEEEDAEIAGAAAVRYWSGGAAELEAPVLQEAGRVVVYGSDEAVESLRSRTPVHVPLVAYHHRTSLALVGAPATEPREIQETARQLAEAVSAFDQRGCVSPHRVFVLGDHRDALRLGEALAGAMETESRRIPPGPAQDVEKARVQQLRGDVELRAAAGGAARVWAGPGTNWTVVVDETERITAYGGPRTLQVTWLAALDDLARVLQRDAGHLQSAGVAGLEASEEVADVLARAGVTRIVPLADMAFPPAWWLHDGAGPLRSLIRWVEWSP